MNKIDDLKTAKKKIDDAIAAIKRTIAFEDNLSKYEYIVNELGYITNCLEFIKGDIDEIRAFIL